MPTPDELGDYYRTTYARRRTWAATPEYLKLMERRAVAQLEFMGPELGEVRSAIDVGCGVGALVRELTRAGIDAVGYDSDQSVIRTGREHFGANVHHGHLGGSGDGHRYDLLCLSHVVEHLASPVSDLRLLADRVRKGGLLFIEVPQAIPWMFTQIVDTESHLGFHTTHSLEILARAAGLQVIRVENCGPPIVDHYTEMRDRAARHRQLPWWKRAGAGVARRLLRSLSRLRPGSKHVHTEYDGYFDHYHPKGDQRGMWLRALFRQPRE